MNENRLLKWKHYCLIITIKKRIFCLILNNWVIMLNKTPFIKKSFFFFTIVELNLKNKLFCLVYGAHERTINLSNL